MYNAQTTLQRLYSEIKYFLIFMGILTIFGYLTWSTATTIQVNGPAPVSSSNIGTLSSSLDANSNANINLSMTGFCLRYFSQITDNFNIPLPGDCVVFLGDITTGSGCSDELQALKDGPLSGDGQLCQYSAAEQKAYYKSSGNLVPYCECSNQLSSFTDYTWAVANKAAIAVQFAPNLSNGEYTISGANQYVSAEDVSSSNVSGNVNAGDAASNIASNAGDIMALQVIIESALVGKPMTITNQFFPQNAYTAVAMSGATILPLYSVLIAAYGLVSITVEICKETKAGLRHGLFMIGLDPFTYW